MMLWQQLLLHRLMLGNKEKVLGNNEKVRHHNKEKVWHHSIKFQVALLQTLSQMIVLQLMSQRPLLHMFFQTTLPKLLHQDICGNSSNEKANAVVVEVKRIKRTWQESQEDVLGLTLLPVDKSMHARKKGSSSASGARHPPKKRQQTEMADECYSCQHRLSDMFCLGWWHQVLTAA